MTDLFFLLFVGYCLCIVVPVALCTKGATLRPANCAGRRAAKNPNDGNMFIG